MLWKATLDVTSASLTEINNVAQGTLNKSFSGAMESRRETVMKEFRAMRLIAELEPTVQIDPEVIQSIYEAVSLANSTLFEGKCLKGLAFAPASKKKHLEVTLKEYDEQQAALGVPSGDRDRFAAPIPLLLSLAKGQVV